MTGGDTPACGDECQEALTDLERYLDGELPGSQLERIQQHLTACYPCTERATFEEQVRAIVRRECVEEAPRDLLARIRTKLQGGDFAR